MYMLLIEYESLDKDAWNWWMVGSLEDCRDNLRARKDAARFSPEKIVQSVIFKVEIWEETA